MGKGIGEKWSPMPDRLLAAMNRGDVSEAMGWSYVWMNAREGSPPSVREVASFAGCGKTKAGRIRQDVLRALELWEKGVAENEAAERTQADNEEPSDTKRDTGGTPAGQLIPFQPGESTTGGTPAGHRRDDRARDLLFTITDAHPYSSTSDEVEGDGCAEPLQRVTFEVQGVSISLHRMPRGGPRKPDPVDTVRALWDFVRISVFGQPYQRWQLGRGPQGGLGEDEKRIRRWLGDGEMITVRRNGKTGGQFFVWAKGAGHKLRDLGEGILSLHKHVAYINEYPTGPATPKLFSSRYGHWMDTDPRDIKPPEKPPGEEDFWDEIRDEIRTEGAETNGNT